RNAPEKLLVTHFPELMPPTLISRDLDAIRAFRRDHGAIIIKPLFGNGGQGVFYLASDDPNFDPLLEWFQASSVEPVMVQRFLPGVTKGDVRVILIDGKAVGAINRIPQPGQIRSNMHVGGQAKAVDLDASCHAICESIGPKLRQDGLLLTGIDVIDGYLTEINVTSPTGIQEINRFNGVRLDALFWDAVERKLA
ncbi:MAG: glutathione synthase, partial [Pseudomonadota bacterium]